MASVSNHKFDDAGIFELLTELCTRTASKHCTHNRLSQRRLSNKMRTHAYEIILRKTSLDCPPSSDEPVVDLLSYYFVKQQGAKTTADYKEALELKKAISTVRQTDYGDRKEDIYNILRLLVGLRGSVTPDHSLEMYQRPFSFGLLDEMLPKPPRELFGSPQPYSYFPSHVFELPFSLKQSDAITQQKSQTYSDYVIESFDSKLYLPDISKSAIPKQMELRTFQSPMSFASLSATHVSPYSKTAMFNYPRLTGPRYLQIPEDKPQDKEPTVKVSLASTVNVNKVQDVQEMYVAQPGEESVDIWELATHHINMEVPEDIWEVVAKLPTVNERQLIAMSPREMKLWHLMHDGAMSDLNIVSEKHFIRHIMYLIIGIETSSFPFSEESNCFYMKENLVLEGISEACISGYISNLLIVGTYYKRLQNFAFNQSLDDHFYSNGLVYEAAREIVRQYLLDFRLKATSIYEESCKQSAENINCMPTLLEILFHMEPLKYEIETVASIFKMIDNEYQTVLPNGAELMSYFFNEISLVTHQTTAHIMFNSLLSVCRVYFKFIERFIFEGELDDRYNEFFIRKDMQYVNCRSKRYWDKGFHITQSMAVPEFLRTLANFILLCGKSLRLLKLCNPSDPLVLLISSDHPSVQCCATFEELGRQQQLLDVYRTRCLFVTGELVTFDQILLKREAERKAFAELATLKQADTLEKIVAERKRLAQLIIAEKQHSLRVLEAAMAEAKAAKQKAKMRERKRHEVEVAGDKATEEVDSKIRDDEKNKIMEYYSKLNMEVEKKQMHTEWKLKRLQLDQSRMQLLSTEERNLKREKLELQHQKNEEMTRSMQETEVVTVEPDEDENIQTDVTEKTDATTETEKDIMTESVNSVVMLDVEEKTPQEEKDTNQKKAQSSTDVFSAICSVAKSFFGVSKTEYKMCDNNRNLDSQGNIVNDDTKSTDHTTSSNVIGANIDESVDNEQFLIARNEALKNKLKVMAHEFGQTDRDNNLGPTITIDPLDENLNEEWSTFAEAKRNKLKVLGQEYNMPFITKPIHEPVTVAQKEALINKQKVLGVEYNLPAETKVVNDPANVAQEEALQNKKRVLSSDYESCLASCSKREPARRSGLTLNLKPYGVSSCDGSTPNAPVTPGELFPGLDLETPTTADVPLEGAITSDIFTPRSEIGKDSYSEKPQEYLSTDGFNFPMLDDVTAENETISDVQTENSPQNSPSKSLDTLQVKNIQNKHSFFNILDGSYDLQDFDPFGVKNLKPYSTEYFTNKMDSEMTNSHYTHPALIMEEVKKPPYSNIYVDSQFKDEKENKTNCDNIATLTACLQRSVMLPLTYQLEVVNNSILTYFLGDLNMYEHLRSLKDYFFLMDGEFSRSICHNLFAKLTKTLNPQELLNFATLHNILDKALGSSISHVHKFSENLSFTISDTPLSFQHSSPDVLQCLSLTYTVCWPLNIILSQEALLRYAKVFQFLIKMRRIFWVLGEDFEHLKLAAKLSKQHSRKLLRSPQYTSIQIYRHIMASMIRAIDNYIVTTCILVSWTEFENDLKKARTLDDLYECHVVYIKKVLFRCLLNNRSTPVMKLLNDMFTVILKFSRVLKAGKWEQKEPNGVFTHPSFSQLQELFHLFEKLAKYLHKVITKLMECGYQRHLVELLTMINLNGYYDPERSREEHNVSVQP